MEIIKIHTTIYKLNIWMLYQISGRQIPFTQNFGCILADILYQVVNRALIIFIDWNASRKTKFPIRHVINRLAGLCKKRIRSIRTNCTANSNISKVAQAMKMNSSIFM